MAINPLIFQDIAEILAACDAAVVCRKWTSLDIPGYYWTSLDIPGYSLILQNYLQDSAVSLSQLTVGHCSHVL